MEKKQNAYFEKREGFVVHCSTGCSCCSGENFLTGFYDTIEGATDSALAQWGNKTLRSQYAAHGRYRVYKVEYIYILLPNEDELFILDDMVFKEDYFYHDLESYCGGTAVGVTNDDKKEFIYAPSWLKNHQTESM